MYPPRYSVQCETMCCLLSKMLSIYRLNYQKSILTNDARHASLSRVNKCTPSPSTTWRLRGENAKDRGTAYATKKALSLVEFGNRLASVHRERRARHRLRVDSNVHLRRRPLLRPSLSFLL